MACRVCVSGQYSWNLHRHSTAFNLFFIFSVFVHTHCRKYSYTELCLTVVDLSVTTVNTMFSNTTCHGSLTLRSFVHSLLCWVSSWQVVWLVCCSVEATIDVSCNITKILVSWTDSREVVLESTVLISSLLTVCFNFSDFLKYEVTLVQVACTESCAY